MTQQRTEYPLDYSTSADKQAGDRLQNAADTAADKAAEIAANAQELATKAMEQAREYTGQAQEAVKNFKPFVEKSMKEQPMATLAVAAAVGVVLGALWKR
jgi:X-X-X-Leu-X-X-Gly heptad repeat protein